MGSYWDYLGRGNGLPECNPFEAYLEETETDESADESADLTDTEIDDYFAQRLKEPLAWLIETHESGAPNKDASGGQETPER